MRPDESEDGGAPGEHRRSLLLEPTVSWADEMTVHIRHLVEVDLALVDAGGAPVLADQWPLPEEEEYAYTCVLDGGGVFDWWAVNDASVVVHRFGGSYGAAKFVVTPREKPGKQVIWLTIFNAWGVPVGSHELPVLVRSRSSPDDAAQERPGPAGPQARYVELPLTPAHGVEAGAGDSGKDLRPGIPRPGKDSASPATGDEITVDIPLGDLPEPPSDALADTEQDFARGAGSPGSTVPDGGYLDVFSPQDDDILRGLYPAGTEPGLAPYAGGSAHLFRRRGGDPPPVRAADRLTEAYNLAALRRSASGNLHWEMVPLFSPGAAAGRRVAFTVSCAPSDEYGTAFAVFAEGADGGRASLRLESVQSAKVPPGVYRVTAELRQADREAVRFLGLPEMPRVDRRRWPEIMAAAPRALAEGTGPVHLIAAIEISGAPDVVRKRIESVRRLVTHVADETAEFVCYSVVTYGPHTVNPNNRLFPEEPVTTLAWAEAADDALGVLDRLGRRPAVPLGYEPAAQLECVLTDLERSLTGSEGRPVIVAVGARPPHPAQVDPWTEIIPCRYYRDWTVPLSQLGRRYPGIVFRGIRDSGRGPDALWRLLGEAGGTSGDYFTPGFAASLGLTGSRALPAVRIPVPLITPAPSAPLPGDG